MGRAGFWLTVFYQGNLLSVKKVKLVYSLSASIRKGNVTFYYFFAAILQYYGNGGILPPRVSSKSLHQSCLDKN
jgi:hypothetical protein